MHDPAELTPTERRALLVWRLATGERLTTRAAADVLLTDCRTAYRFLTAVSRVLPVYYDDPDDPCGPRWQRM